MKSATDNTAISSNIDIKAPNISINQASKVDITVTAELPFTKENLIYFWTKFSKRFENEDIRLFNILSSNTLELNGLASIRLGVFNSLQIEQFEKIKPQLINYLISNLENRQITIDTFILENIEIAKPLSLNDKYEIMVKKNLLLKEFKDRLNLDFD